MTVKELIELLSAQDPDAKVYVYEEVSESMGGTYGVYSIETEEDIPYVKSWLPWRNHDDDPQMPDHKAVFIG